MTAMKFIPETRMLVDGKLIDADDGRTFDNVNPATEEVLGQVADASTAEMQRAIRAAREAFDHTDWRWNRALRRRVLEQLHAAIADDLEEVREELIAEVGAPRAVTHTAQLDAPLEDGLLWPARMIDEFEWERDMGDSHAFGVHNRRMVWKEPIGVVGVITPWNYPFEIIVNKIGQVLATGNTMVLKPAPDTPWSATRFGRLLAEKTDIPPGVVNIVTSSDHLVGEELTLSPLVDMIAFVGSTATGKRIMEKGAQTLKRVFLELGGKSASIVLDDADFGTVVPAAAGMCMHAGQGCAMRTRLLLPRSRYAEGVELITAAMRGVSYGDPQDPAHLMGPVISRRQHERVLGYVATGVEEGATLAVGGRRPPHLEKGWFVEPTLFVDVDNSMTIAREEIFGPVLVVIPFEDDADAIRIANDSPYGLSGAIASGDLARATAVARQIRTGALGINGGTYYGADMPYGGFGESGIGRQNGIEGFEQLLETRSVAWRAS
ncbi:MAG: aldehyde dehydrogenase family protein [Nocardioides sp.]|uniref:aldehyde dehydrogenase family protein n=1 Tax=Nocardioides sp. TaxID=35761 RepID=UPI0039E32D14